MDYGNYNHEHGFYGLKPAVTNNTRFFLLPYVILYSINHRFSRVCALYDFKSSRFQKLKIQVEPMSFGARLQNRQFVLRKYMYVKYSTHRRIDVTMRLIIPTELSSPFSLAAPV